MDGIENVSSMYSGNKQIFIDSQSYINDGVAEYEYLSGDENNLNNHWQGNSGEHGTQNNLGENVLKSQYGISERDFSIPLEKHKESEFNGSSEEDPSEISIRKYLGVGVQWVSLLTENLLSHPFIVIRRQCQVFHASEKYHLHPISLIPSILHLYKRQGVSTYWKGLGSCLLVRGMSLAVEDLTFKFISWPKNIDSRSSIKRFGQHILLKCISIAVVIPFYSASLVETVQSDIASEKPGILDVFQEGSTRLLFWTSQKGRMLPIWVLIGPSISIGISKYIFGLLIKGILSRMMRRRIKHLQEQSGAKLKESFLQTQNVVMYSNLLSVLTSDIFFYPFETVLHRIQLQGTRTIIDNLDNGYAVVPILTNYQGAVDCYKTTISSEGICGLYKGFGAIILQLAAHIAVIKLTKWVFAQVTEVVSCKPPSKVVRYYNLERSLKSSTTTISRSLSASSNMDGSFGLMENN